MTDTNNKPVIFLAFANDRDDGIAYLRNLPDEARRLRDVLAAAEQAGLCETVVRSNSTAGDIFKVFQDPKYRNRVAIFHYGGHANGYQLLLESAGGEAAAADAGGLAAFLSQQQGLQLIFLNGCSTQHQTQGLLDANVSAVISTSRSIEDRVAMDFAHQFYQGLAGGATVRTAYNEAEAAVQTAKGGDTRDLYFEDDDSHAQLEADRFPWNLYLREGSEAADQWNLPEAVDDPLFGLPPLPQQDLPESPYRHLNWFTHKDAEVFFGRGHQIRELYDRLTAPRTAPIMLFYGQSGVGKSSILDAGLIPRLEQDYEVRYVRRGSHGLLATLQSALAPESPDDPVETAWSALEERTNKPVIVFLDQVEELYTRPVADLPDELEQLLRGLEATFSDRSRRPKGKLVLGFRKEWLAEFESHLIDDELPRTKVFLEPLDRRGIIEVVHGPARTERLRERYGLTVEDGLPEVIADDLLEDRDSAIAPTLQILLTKLWTKATAENYEHPHFSQDLYQQLKRDGILLRDFLNQQIAVFRERYPEVVDSGLLLDIIALHTTALGTAGQCDVEELQQQYAHLGTDLADLLQQCQDLHLLTVAASTRKEGSKKTRLAHDTLAPLVRERFDESDKPGQRARRILDNRSLDWADDQVGTPLDEADLAVVEQGVTGTRALSAAEQRLLDASRNLRARRQRNRRTLKIAGIAASVAIAMLGAFGWWQSIEANSQKRAALTQVGNAQWQRAVSARDYDQDSMRAAHLFVTSARAFVDAEETKQAASSLAAIDHGVVATFPHVSSVLGALFNGDESQVLSWGGDGTLLLWDASKGELIRTFIHDEDTYVTGALFNAVASRALSWGGDNTLRLWNIEQDEPIQLFKHERYVGGALFTTDGSQVLSWGDEGAQLWDAHTGERVRAFGHGNQVTGAMFSRDGSLVLSWGRDETVRLWDRNSGDPVLQFSHSGILGARFNDDESQILSWGGTMGQLWGIAQNEPLHTFEQVGPVIGAAINADGSWVVIWSSRGLLMVHDVKTGQFIKAFMHMVPPGLFGVLLLNTGNELVSWGGDGTLRRWNILQDVPTQILQHDGSIRGATLSSDQSRVLSWGDDGTAQLWEINQNELLQTFTHKTGTSVYGALFSGDESRLLSWGYDGSARLWHVSNDKPTRVFEHGESVRSAMLNEDASQVLTTGEDGTVRLWDANSGETLQTIQQVADNWRTAARFNADGSRVLIWGRPGTVMLWDVAMGESMRTFEHLEALGAQLSDDETHVLSWGHDMTVRFWDISQGEPPRVFQHDDAVFGATLNSDQSRLLSWSEGETAWLWDTNSGNLVTEFSHVADAVLGATFSSDASQVLSWGGDGSVRLWDARTGEPDRIFDHHTAYGDVGARFSSDESRVLSWGGQGTVKVWDVARDELIRTFNHDGVLGALFSSDESRVLSWCRDGTVQLWDMAQDEPVRTLRHGNRISIHSALFVNNDSQILSWDTNGAIRLWDVEQDEPVREFQHGVSLTGAMFNASESQVLSWGDDGSAQLWDVPTFDDVSIDTINDTQLELEVRTGATITDQGAYELLTFDEWLEKRNQLHGISDEPAQ